MKSSSRTTLLVATLSLAVAALLATGFLTQDRLIEQWYLWELRSPDVETRRHAIERLAELRSSRAAIPLATIVKEDSETLREEVGSSMLSLENFEAELTQSHRLIESCLDGQALIALQRIGVRAKHAIPLLLEEFSRRGIVSGTDVVEVRTLESVGAESVAQIVDALGHESSAVRDIAAKSLGRLGPRARSAIPDLVWLATHDEEHIVRWAAVWALAQVGDAAFAALLDCLVRIHEQDGHRADFSGVARALEGMGQRRLSQLVWMLKDAVPRRRAVAVRVLGHLGGEEIRSSEEAVAGVLRLLQDPDVDVRRQAAGATRIFDKRADSFVPALVPLLRDSDAGVRWAAITSLRAMGLAAAQAVPEMVNRISDDEEAVRNAAIDALGALGPNAQAAVPALVSRLRCDAATRSQVATALGKIGVVAKDAIPDLVQMFLEDRRSENRAAAARALVEIGIVNETVLSGFVTILNDDDDAFIRCLAADSLGAFGNASKEATAALTAALNDSDEWVREAARTALKAIRGNQSGVWSK